MTGCLNGSEQTGDALSGSGMFLSCLYGSELVLAFELIVTTFLSCLYGSELKICPAVPVVAFLSCLYGSEPACRAVRPSPGLSKLPVRQ